jgi:ribosomal protein S12 methylthiotransferase accessory factor
MGDSNGNAAGWTLEEAVLQGFLELVERDAISMWWYNRLQRPEVDLDSFAEPYLAELQKWYRRHQRVFWVLDLTSDLQIPTFASISRLVGRPDERIMFGFGSHFEPRIALLRAVTEMNQTVDMDPDKDIEQEYADPPMRWWLRNATCANQPYLVPDPRAAKRMRADFPALLHEDVLEDVQACQRIVEKRGMQMFILDQTRPDIGLPVVKVIVPGLRHFWTRLAPGRLYDVPVAMGWLDKPRTEDELNPIDMFI